MRVPLVAGNWKMHLDLARARALAEAVRGAVAAGEGRLATEQVEVALFPPYPFLDAVGTALGGSGVSLGAQNAYFEPEGAFTGEVSCEMLRSLGARYVIVGHSERRRIFREDDGLLNMKVREALATGLAPILCVGETLDERERGRTLAVVSQQLALGLDGLAAREVAPLVLAYEPVWAIGTGKNATAAEAEEVHAFIRAYAADRFSSAVADALRILYGGSVKAKNAAELLAEKDVDGALVGGASLDAREFVAIAMAAAGKRAAQHRA